MIEILVHREELDNVILDGSRKDCEPEKLNRDYIKEQTELRQEELGTNTGLLDQILNSFLDVKKDEILSDAPREKLVLMF